MNKELNLVRANHIWFAFAWMLRLFIVIVALSPVLTAQAKADPLVLHDAMRNLWRDHSTFTRLFIVSTVGDLPDQSVVVKRLLQNHEDIGSAIKPFYGDEAGEQLTVLLRDHTLIAEHILRAEKNGDQSERDDAIVRWYANAEAIAAFLCSLNPTNWPREAMTVMWYEHLDLTRADVTAQLTGDYPASMAAYDQVHEQTLKMADVFSAGIIRHFPHTFNGKQKNPISMLSLRVWIDREIVEVYALR